ncbi:helix-turn-helix domain-containing protein [Nocardioides mesophilus]|uniref:GAF domain-containing protein n=1 Tax=Nocardioides mesophilus TaxID=433659 RepID=A0A7G9R9Y9_9ACTN|nr:helix-turn-helix domain-containing protein [Nocardioides mesophilus]QNN52414.1 GAF domain-containing protein [Nocardioides mesophilus]
MSVSEEHLAGHRVRQAVLAGGPAPATAESPRPVIEASWTRLLRRGLDPGSDPVVPPLAASELERRRAESRLGPLVAHLRDALRPAVESTGQLMVVTDPEGRVLWRDGQAGVRRLADRLGFVGGSAWTEGNVGTNAIGTCLVLGEPVQIHGAEHYVESHTRWGCAAAPVHDPWTGRVLGVVDVSGPTRGMHPTALTMVQLAARVAELEVRQEHRAELDLLRAHAAPLVARLGGRALVVDRHGHLAAATGMSAPERVTLPDGLGVGKVWLPTLGAATAEALPGGWLLRLEQEDASVVGAALLTVDLSRPAAQVTVQGVSGGWHHTLTPRHTEILVALATHPAGRSAAELAADLFADPTRVVTVRAEMSRLRRTLGPLLRRQPYRIDEAVRVELVLPPDRSALLAGSSAPVVTALRAATPAPLDR